MMWTTPADLKNQVQRLWDRGIIPAAITGSEDESKTFPKRLTLKVPNSRELSERFAEVRTWIGQLMDAAGYFRIEWRSVNHRVLGSNEIPTAIWIDTLDDALAMIGKRLAADRLAALVAKTREEQPELLPWLAKRPLRALELSEDWPRLLAVVAWLRRNPRPAVYLRQIDLPGVHSKFIEDHRGVLGELLDLALPPEAIEDGFSGGTGFCRRFGFLEKPMRVRFRILDQDHALLALQSDQDITLTKAAFAELPLSVSTVFITENEINFLAFPYVADAMVIFGAGYGFDNLAAADWLRERKIQYWGDIDTHGFAILNQLRRIFPQVTSFLMNRETFLAHRTLWGTEAQPENGNLDRLNPAEGKLYDELRTNRWGNRIRLEQERIGFDFLLEALRTM